MKNSLKNILINLFIHKYAYPITTFMNAEELAAELIRFNTEVPPGNEEACAAFLRDYFLDLRLEECEVVLHRFAENRANLLVRVGPKGQAGLLLSGHIDVVPAGDHSLWENPPFEPKIVGDKLYGRGASDMKSAVAALVKAIENYKDKKLRRGIIFVATAGEEIGCDGLEALISDGKIKERDAMYGIIGEPTNLRVVRAHKGGTTFRITFHGKSAHSSRPELGINAIENASRFILEIAELRNRLKEIIDPDLGTTVISTTMINGGTKENVIPEKCQIIVDCRRIPLHSDRQIMAELNKIVDKIKNLEPSYNASIEIKFNYEALNIPKNHQLVLIAEEILGHKSEVAPYGTEGPIYQRIEIPTIILGPGKVENNIHGPNEYIEIKQIYDAINVYSEFIRRICI